MPRSILTIVLHAVISLGLFVYAIYVLVARKVLIAGKLTGHVYQLNYPANIIIAFSLLLSAIFVITVLINNPLIKKFNPFILLLAIILFIVGAFI